VTAGESDEEVQSTGEVLCGRDSSISC